MQYPINASIVADSISPKGNRLTTFQLSYPRYIHCFDSETELLVKMKKDSPPEFRKFSEVAGMDIFVGQVTFDQKISFVKPNSWVVNDFCGELLSLKNQRISFSVTPEHRLFVGSRKRNRDHKEVILAKELLNNPTQKRFYKCGLMDNLEDIGNDFAKFIAFFVADGHCPKLTKNLALFRFKKQRKTDEVERLLKSLGKEYTKTVYKDGVTSLNFHRDSWMDDCYNTQYNKKLPNIAYNMSLENFSEFKKGLLESDGNLKNLDYNTSSEELINNLQVLFTIHQDSFNIKKYEDRYKVKFLVEKEPIFRKDKHTINKVPYSGKVYCCSVDTGLILVRKDGICHISGNCEIMTHRLFSRNAQSSRAVPVDKMIQFNSDPVVPYVYGKNKAGMSSKEEMSGWRLAATKLIWKYAATGAFTISKLLSKLGLHKQWANRITEPFSTITVIITATEWDNFFWLRDDPDAAQPEIVALARLMKDKLDQSLPVQLEKGQWHLPYIHTVTTASKQWYYDSDGNSLNIGEALKISASCCAQVSYRKLNESKEKAIEIFTKLFSGPKPHMSPTEHQGCVMENEKFSLEEMQLNTGVPKFAIGVSHMDRDLNYWSGNLKGFIQYRKLLEVQE